MANARPDLDALQALLDKNPHDGTDAALRRNGAPIEESE